VIELDWQPLSLDEQAVSPVPMVQELPLAHCKNDGVGSELTAAPEPLTAMDAAGALLKVKVALDDVEVVQATAKPFS
jgi:hypothetical protein